MNRNEKSLLGRLWSAIIDLLPDGGIGDEGAPPDVDGQRDADNDYRRAVLAAKSQMSLDGHATTSYEPVDRSNVSED